MPDAPARRGTRNVNIGRADIPATTGAAGDIPAQTLTS